MSTDGGTIRFGLTTDGKRMENALARMTAKVGELESKYRSLAAQSKKHASESEGGWNRIVGGAAKAVAAYATISTAVSKLIEVHRELSRVQSQATSRTVSIGAKESALGLAFGAAATFEEKRKAAEMVFNLVKSGTVKGYTPGELLDVAEAVAQKTLGGFPQRYEETKRFTSFADLYASKKDSAGEALRASLGIARQLGFGDPKIPKAMQDKIANMAVGFTVDVLSQAAIQDPSQLTEFEKVAAAMQTFDTNDVLAKTPQEKLAAQFQSMRTAGALFSAVTSASPEAPEAGTFDAQQMAALAELLPSPADLVEQKNKRRQGAKLLSGELIDTFEERLIGMSQGVNDARGRFISPEALQNKFFLSAAGDPKLVETRKKLVGFAHELVRGGPLRDLYEEGLAATPTMQQLTPDRITNQIAENFGLTERTQAFARDLREKAKADVNLASNEDLRIRGELQRKLFDPEQGVFTTTATSIPEVINNMLVRGLIPISRNPVAMAESLIEGRLKHTGGVSDEDKVILRNTLDEIREMRKNTRGISAAGSAAAAQNRGQTEGR